MAPRKKKKQPPVNATATAKWLSKYHDVRTRASLGGVRRFAQAHKLPLKTAQRPLEQDLAYTLHKPRRRRFPTFPVIVGGLDDQWVVDLVEVQPLAKYNRGVRYLMTVVDALSKYAWIQPLKAKTGVAVVQAFDKILRQGRRPNRLQTDRGKEFYNRTFQQWAQKHGIQHFSTDGDAKAALVERFNRTLKERLYRYFTAANTFQFLDELPRLVEGYNATRHRAIGMAPQDVTWSNEEAVWNHLYGKWLNQKPTRPTFQVGDRVRLNKVHRTFEKGYLPGWTEEVFVVHRVIPGPLPTYKIHEWDGSPVEGTFYKEDLQKVQLADDALFRIEKVLKRQKGQMFVKWQGWPDKYNSWIPSQALTTTTTQKTRKRKRP